MEQHDLLIKLQQDLGLFRRDFDNAMKNFDTRFDRLGKDLVEIEKYLASEIKPNTKDWNKTSDNISRVVWIVVTAVVLGLLTLLGLR